MKGLRRLQAGGILLREVRAIRQALERIAVAQERQTQLLEPEADHRLTAREEDDPVTITEVDSQLSMELTDIELRLTGAKGVPPTEEEILAAYDAEHKEPDDPRRLAVLEGVEQPRRRS